MTNLPGNFIILGRVSRDGKAYLPWETKFQSLPMEPTKLEGQTLLPYSEIITLAKKVGVDFGKGYPYNRLRYYTKIGLLPRAQRKSFGASPEGCYPSWVVDKLVDVDRKLKSGATIQAILREESDPKTNPVTNLEPITLTPAYGVYPNLLAQSEIDHRSSIVDSRTSNIDHPTSWFPFLGKTLAYSTLLLIILGASLVSAYFWPPTHQGLRNIAANLGTKDSISRDGKDISRSANLLSDKVGSVLGRATSPFLKINVETEMDKLLSANGGIVTNGADVNLGDGQLTASNVIYDIVAGENVTVGTGQTPTISVPDITAGIGSVSGTAGRITSTGGDNPAINIASNYAGQTSINTLGTITTGNWNGSVISDAFINNNLTISSSGSVAWSALNSYPASCGAGEFVRAVGDALTCVAESGGVPTTRTLTAGAGLSGGGDLSADRTFDVGAGNGITVNANDVEVNANAADFEFVAGVLNIAAGAIEDDEVDDDITISSSGSVDWSALTGYPADCSAGSALTGFNDANPDTFDCDADFVESNVAETITGGWVFNTNPTTFDTDATFNAGIIASALSGAAGTALCIDGTDNIVTCNAGSSSATLQSAYDAGNSITTADADGSILFNLADTAADQDFIVDILGTGNTFEVRDNNSPILSVADGGTVGITGTLDVSGHGAFGGGGSVLSSRILNVSETFTTGGARGLVVNPTFNPSALTTVRSFDNTPTFGPTGASTITMVGDYVKSTVGGSNTGAGTSLYNSYIDSPTIGGTTVVNNYGLYMADQSGATNNYALYQTGTSATNILNANTRIGSTTIPAATLDIAGTLLADSDVTLSHSGTENLEIISTSSTDMINLAIYAHASALAGAKTGILISNAGGGFPEGLDIGLNVTNVNGLDMPDGILIDSSSGTYTDAIDVSDSDIVNALNVGSNVILGTTPTIDFTNFDVSSGGQLTFTGVSTDITTGANEDLTLSPNGTGDIILSTDGDTSAILSSFANNNGVVYTNGSGVLAQTATGGAGTLCLTSASGAAPLWSACSGSAATAWSSLTAPSGSLSIAHAANTTSFTFNSVTSGTAWTQSSTSLTTGILNQESFTSALAATGTTTGLRISPTIAGTAAANTYTINALDLAAIAGSCPATATCRNNAMNIGSYAIADADQTSVAINIADQYNATGTHYGICFDCDGTYSNAQAANGINWGNDANSVDLYRSDLNTLKTDDTFEASPILTDTSGVKWGGILNADIRPTADSSGTFSGVIGQAQILIGTTVDLTADVSGVKGSIRPVFSTTSGSVTWAKGVAGVFDGAANVSINFTNFANFHAKDPTLGGATITNSYGLYLEPQTQATNNYGICFDCDGTFGTQTVGTGIRWGTDATTANNVQLYRSADGTALLELGDGTDLISAAAATFSLNLDNTTSRTERLCHGGGDAGTGIAAISDCSGTPGDYAEEYGTADSSIEAGDLVAVDSNRQAQGVVNDGQLGSKAWVLKSKESYEPSLIGVVSTNPNEVIGKNFNSSENPRPVALNGRVPLKVSSGNGSIAPGDPLTSSSTPGVAMKATKSGAIVGKALQSYDGSGVGKIIAFVSVGWYVEPIQTNGEGQVTSLEGSLINSLTINSIQIGENKLGLDNQGDLRLDGNLVVAGDINISGDLALTGDLVASSVKTDELKISDKTSGSGEILAGKSFVAIENVKLTKDSKVVTTFTSDWAGATRYWITKEDGKFEVHTDQSVTSNASFDWIIIN